MNARVCVLTMVVAGCAPQLQAVKKEVGSREGIRVSFCGSARLSQETWLSGWAPGHGGFVGRNSEDSGQSDVCLEFANGSDGVLDVDRRRIRIVGDGHRGHALRDEQDRVWRIAPGARESLRVTFLTDSFARGEELNVSFAGAARLDGAPVRLAPLRLAYR